MTLSRIGRIGLALAAPFLLLGCILTPGKFTSSLRIDADRSFTFAYKGEVIAIDMSDSMKGLGDSKDSGSDSTIEAPAEPEVEQTPTLFQPVGWQDEGAAEGTRKKPDEDVERKRRAIAETLKKEAGYRSVEYLGDGKYIVDYEISGTLNHGFVYPYNLDAEIMFPFIAIELRGNGTVRVKAPAFGNEKTGSDSGMGMGRDDASKMLDGVFTLDTDAEIVSQNNEDGVTATGARRAITWRVTPLSKAAPTAVLRMAK